MFFKNYCRYCFVFYFKLNDLRFYCEMHLKYKKFEASILNEILSIIDYS